MSDIVWDKALPQDCFYFNKRYVSYLWQMWPYWPDWPRQVPRLTWKWGGRTNPFKSGNSSSVANLEKNIHCSWQDGHIIGTGNTWIFRKCLRKKFFVHNFCHNLGQTILLQFDHCPACLLHHKDFSFSMFLYFSRAPFCICLALRQVPHHCFPHVHCVFLSFHCVYNR